METIISLIIDDMTDQEILAQRLAILLNVPHKDRYGYAKIVTLLTQDDNTAMPSDVKAIFLHFTGIRLGLDS